MIDKYLKTKLLNTKPTYLRLFRNCRFVCRANAFGSAHAAWYWHKCSHAKSKLTQITAFTVELQQQQGLIAKLR